MALPAKGDQIRLAVVAETAARAEVVDFQILDASAVLAAPGVPHEHFESESAKGLRIQAKARALSTKTAQEAFRICSRIWLCAGGGSRP